MALDLLAPARVWVAEVDAVGSRVRVIAGDFEQETLGRVMSAAPFARAVEIFRYRGTNARLPALVACASRQQAYDLHLCAHRPAGTPAPEVVLGETRPADRAQIPGGFEAGQLDTLIQVGVPIEGWNSPRCKLLRDLAPTLSRVRATQKFFRVMTKHEGAEARLYVLLPKGLPELPILPMELFGRSCREYECGELIGSEGRGGAIEAPRRPIRSSTVQRARRLAAALAGGTVDGRGLRDLAGARACGLGSRTGAAGSPLGRCRQDARHLLRALPRAGGSPRGDRNEGFAEGWRALTGYPGLEPELAGNPLQTLPLREQADEIAWATLALPAREQRVIALRFGLFDQPETTRDALAQAWAISGARIGPIEARALRALRRRGRRDRSGVSWLLPSLRRGKAMPFRRGLRQVAAAKLAGAGWVPMEAALPVRELLPRLAALLERLGSPAAVIRAEPSLRGFDDRGVAFVDACWQADGVRVKLVRRGSVHVRPEGGERLRQGIEASVSGLCCEAQLLLAGSLGVLEAYAVVGGGAHDRDRVEDSWRAVAGLGPRAPAPRGRR